MMKKQQIMNKYISIPKDKEKYEPDEQTLKFLSEKWKIKILKNIGFGGFSLVKLVYSEKTSQYYALKVVNKYIHYQIFFNNIG
jgi:serine/threonine protein kinase